MKKVFVLVVLAIILYISILRYKKLDSKARQSWLVILGITFLSSLPLLFKGLNTNGHDITFHIFRIEGIVHEIRTHHFPARIYSFWNEGYGYPTGIYYGDVLLYFPAFLRFCGFTINTAFKVFVATINLCTAVVSYGCFKRLFKSDKTAYVLALAYCANPYRMTDLYVRHSVGEYCAMLFIPIVMLAYARIITHEHSSLQQTVYNGALLGLGMAGIVTSHILTTSMVVFSLILFSILLIKQIFKPDALKSILIAIVTAILASAFFVVPFLDYMLNVTTYSSATMENGVFIQDQGIGMAELFAFFSKDPASFVQLTPGLFLMATLFTGLYLCVTRKVTGKMKLLTITSVFFLWLTLGVFPWDAIAKCKPLRIFTQIQYPWRYLTIACLLLTLLAGFILTYAEADEKTSPLSYDTLIKAGTILSLTSAFVFVSLFAFNPTLKYYKEETTYFPTGVTEYKRAAKVAGAYVFTDFEKYEGPIEGDFEEVDIIKNEGLNLAFHVKTSNNEAEVILPRTNYPGYRIVDEAGNSYSIHDSDNLLVAFDLPAGFEGDIFMTYVEPWYWRLALIVSIISVPLMVAYLYRQDKKKLA